MCVRESGEREMGVNNRKGQAKEKGEKHRNRKKEKLPKTGYKMSIHKMRK